MEDPVYNTLVTVGGNKSSYRINAFPRNTPPDTQFTGLQEGQSFILSAQFQDEQTTPAPFDIAGATATLYVSAYNVADYTPVMLVAGVLSDSGSGTTDTVTFTVPKGGIPGDLGEIPGGREGNAVFYFILEDADSKLQFSQVTNVYDEKFALTGSNSPSSSVLVVSKNDLGTVIDTTLTTPPVSPSFGDSYICGVGSTGDWSGEDNNLAVYNGSAWIFSVSVEGNFVYDSTLNDQLTFDGSAWSVKGVGDGSITTVKIADNAVDNTKLSDMTQDTIKGRVTAGTGDPEDLTTGQVRTMLAISNVDNTSDVSKPISTVQQIALDLKLDATATAADTLKINGKTVDNTDISNGRVLKYDGPNDKLIYADESGGGGAGGVDFPYNFSTDITATDPTAGVLKVNNATLGSSTEMYISATAANNVDLSTRINSLGSGDQFYFAKPDDSASFLDILVTSVTDNTGWFTIAYTVNTAGTTPANTDAIQTIFDYVTGGAASGVSSLNGRTGAVTLQASDIDASQVDNDSTVAGAFVSDALDQLDSDKMDVSVYDGASIQEQLVGLSATQSLTNKEINSVTLVGNGGGTQVLYDDGIYRTPPGAVAGEANTASNTGLGDAGLFKTKAGVDLIFKDIVGGTNCTITSQTDTVTINATGESNSASNLTGDEGLFAQKNGIDLEFKALTAGSNVTLSSDANAVTINATGEANTSSNTGAGAQLAKAKSGSDLPFRTLESSDASVSITQNADTVDLVVTGEANTSSNTGAGAQLAKAKSGSDLPFRTLTSTDASLTITQDTDTIDLIVDGGGFPSGKVTGLATTGTVNIDWSAGDTFVVGTLTGDVTFTFSNVTQGQPITIQYTSASGYDVTMPVTTVALNNSSSTVDEFNSVYLKATDGATEQEIAYTTTVTGDYLPRTLEINNTATGAYSIVSGDGGKLVNIDAGLTIPTGLYVGFQCSVFLDNGTKQAITTTGLTVKGNSAANISANGTIGIAIIATDTILITGETEA